MPPLGEVSQLLTAIAALGALAVSIYNAIRIKEVKHATNSMHDEIVALTKSEGITEGRAMEKADNPKG